MKMGRDMCADLCTRNQVEGSLQYRSKMQPKPDLPRAFIFPCGGLAVREDLESYNPGTQQSSKEHSSLKVNQRESMTSLQEPLRPRLGSAGAAAATTTKVNRAGSSAQAISLPTADRYTKFWFGGRSMSKSVIKSKCMWPFGCIFSTAQLSLEDDARPLALKGAATSGADSILSSGLGALKPPRGTPEFHTRM